MKSFKIFVEDLSNREIPWESNPNLGWWRDQDPITLYHGTHKRNISSFLENGILLPKNPPANRIPEISLALDPYTAFGYAAMSGSGGEVGFRQAGSKVSTTPVEDRVVFKLEIPMNFILKYYDGNLGGNRDSGDIKSRTNIKSKEEYTNWKQLGKTDVAYYALTELRIKNSIPSEYIVGYMFKVKK
jgi:hypothetical protein